MVVAGTANVGVVGEQLALPGGSGRPLVEPVLEDRLDRSVGTGADVETAVAGRLQSVGAVLPRQAQDAEAGAVALLGMGPALQDQLGELGGAWTDYRRFTADPLDGPLGIAPVRTRHVFGDRGVPATTGAAQVDGDALASAEQLNGMGGDARFELLADQPVRYRVIVPVDVDVIIGRNAADPPFGIFVGLGL